MAVKFSEEKKIDYVCLKLGDKVFSTNYEDIKAGKTHGHVQIAETKGIGDQVNVWLKGRFTEKGGHAKLEKPEPFELNIYFHDEKV